MIPKDADNHLDGSTATQLRLPPFGIDFLTQIGENAVRNDSMEQYLLHKN
jgi:hypothetical protein